MITYLRFFLVLNEAPLVVRICASSSATPAAFDVVVGDSLYVDPRFFTFVIEQGKDAIAVLKANQPSLLADAPRAVRHHGARQADTRTHRVSGVGREWVHNRSTGLPTRPGRSLCGVHSCTPTARPPPWGLCWPTPSD